jgi:hypothetical protein
MSLTFDSNAISPSAPPTRYRALNPLAVTSTVLAALSIVTMLSWFLVVIPLAGIIIGWIALRQIRTAPEEWMGLRLAQIGLGLSTAMWVFGYGWLILAKTSEVPFGYTPITYDMLQPDPTKPTEIIPQAAQELQDAKVFIQGYMQARRQQIGIKEFILCPASGDCAFCMPNPSPTQKIRVMMQGDKDATYTPRMISIAGRFRVNLYDPSGIPYGIEVDSMR